MAPPGQRRFEYRPSATIAIGAATQSVVEIGSLISRSPDVRGGRSRIAGTGVTVSRVVTWHRRGLTPEEIAGRIGHVSVGQIHAALAYYHANRA
ncbi:MAG: DUF433 domain-containing protein [Chloroflexota bacterium]